MCLQLALMKLAVKSRISGGTEGGERAKAERKKRGRRIPQEESGRVSRIPDIGINSAINHSAGPVHKVIAITPRALQRADLWTGGCLERKSNPLRDPFNRKSFAHTQLEAARGTTSRMHTRCPVCFKSRFVHRWWISAWQLRRGKFRTPSNSRLLMLVYKADWFNGKLIQG